ncbi:MAG: recombinase family protein, partial [Alphaproteobacteria bacterium]
RRIDRQRIKDLSASGLGVSAVANTIGCSRMQVYRVLQGG